MRDRRGHSFNIKLTVDKVVLCPDRERTRGARVGYYSRESQSRRD